MRTSSVLLRLRGVKLKCNLIKSGFQLIRKYFLFLSIFGEVVLFCKKGKLTTRIKCETLS